MSELTQAVELVRKSRMDAWRAMAKEMPDHHVLAVELFRVENDQTIAIFPLVRNGEPVQEVVTADGRGVGVRPVVPNAQLVGVVPLGKGREIQALTMAAVTAAASDDGSAPGIAIGEPPPKQSTEPGIVAVGEVMMPAAFDVAERLT